MLESRGAVYRRERSARFEAHDGCNCTAEPVWRREEEPPYVQELRGEFQRVTGHLPTKSEKLRAWNRYWRQKQRSAAIADLTPEVQAMQAVPAGLFRQAGAPVLTRAERQALRDYQSSFFTAINGQLRRRELTKTMEKLVGRIDAVLARSRLREKVTVWRGTGRGRVFGDRIGGDLTGFEWTEHAFLSTSVDTRMAMSFAQSDAGELPLLLRITAPQGTGAVRISQAGWGGQGEILLERGLRLRVTRDTTTKVGRVTARVLDVEVVPKKATQVAERPPAPAALSRESQQAIAEAIQRAGEVADMSDRARRHTAAALRRQLGDAEARAAAGLLEALEGGSAQAIRDAAAAAARAAGLRQVGVPGEVLRLPATHIEWIGAGRSPVVQIVRPGWEDASGRVVQRAAVQAATAEQAGAVAGQAARGLTRTDLSIQKAREQVAEQLADVEQLAERGASSRAVIATMRSRMRRLRVEPVDAAGNPLAGTSPSAAVRYVWRRPGGDVDLLGPEPDNWPPGELEEFRLAAQMARVALAVEHAARAGRSITDAAAQAAGRM